jgi:hypothetical protein
MHPTESITFLRWSSKRIDGKLRGNMDKELELAACTPRLIHPAGFNPNSKLPYGLTIEHLQAAMNDFTNFLSFINLQLHSREIERLESMLMPAYFSSIVGEFMASSIPKHCSSLAKNQYHNGHSDIIPRTIPNDAVQHALRVSRPQNV